ncbi:MAG: putative ABC transporter ATP-binding protein YknY [Verrucomicrobiae bacterium]|nr:putative ABC transporter ATP-binding protein YknY [Verrucomicrobiae bacterium]
MLIHLRNVSKTYGDTYALRDVDLDIHAGEYLSIMGPSGSGKSTLFNMIGGLDHCTTGTVEIGGVKLNTLTDGQLAYFRGRHIGYVFQSYNLIPSMTALKNVALPAVLAGNPTIAAESRAREVLGKVGLSERVDHRPDELSGGQQQRVAIARALVNTPTIILADEPTANLDLHTGEQIIELLQHLCHELGITIVTATHDHKMLKASHRIVWIKDGRVDRIENVADLTIEEGGMERAG